jgi:hypothetical protein
MLTIALFLFPTAGHCAAKRRQHSWPLVYLAIPKTWTIVLLLLLPRVFFFLSPPHSLWKSTEQPTQILIFFTAIFIHKKNQNVEQTEAHWEYFSCHKVRIRLENSVRSCSISYEARILTVRKHSEIRCMIVSFCIYSKSRLNLDTKETTPTYLLIV